MVLRDRDFTLIANQLWESRTTLRPCEPLTTAYPEMDLDDAYQISQLVFQRRVEHPNIRPIGRKIGLTSLAVQRQLGVNQPDFGFLTSDMVVPTHGKGDGLVPPGRLIQPRVEGEVAFVLKSDLSGPNVGPKEVIAATEYVVACIEIIDSRIKDWKIKAPDTVADNASSAMLVLGKNRRKIQDLDLRMAGMTLRKNGEVEATGIGAACMDHPVHAVAWLANFYGARGENLCSGDLILSGAYGPVVSFSPGDFCEVEISGLGKVRVSYGL